MKYEIYKAQGLPEAAVLLRLVDEFADAMKNRLLEKMKDNHDWAWASDTWQEDEIRACIQHCLDNTDLIDLANYALFFWNRSTKLNPETETPPPGEETGR